MTFIAAHRFFKINGPMVCLTIGPGELETDSNDPDAVYLRLKYEQTRHTFGYSPEGSLLLASLDIQHKKKWSGKTLKRVESHIDKIVHQQKRPKSDDCFDDCE